VTDNNIRTAVFLSVQRALVGSPAPEIRAVSLDLSRGKIVISVYHDGVASDQLHEGVAEIITEVLADVPEGQEVVSSLVRSDAPGPVPLRGDPVFAVKGTTFR